MGSLTVFAASIGVAVVVFERTSYGVSTLQSLVSQYRSALSLSHGHTQRHALLHGRRHVARIVDGAQCLANPAIALLQ